MKNYSLYNSVPLEKLSEQISSDLDAGLTHCMNDRTTCSNPAPINIIDVYLYRLSIPSEQNSLDKASSAIDVELLKKRKDVNSPFLTGNEGYGDDVISYSDFLLYTVHPDISTQCIDSLNTTSANSNYHPLIVLTKKGKFTLAVKIADLCTNVPETKKLQKAFVIGMNAASQATPMELRQEDQACLQLIKNLNMPIDFKFKGKRFFELAGKTDFPEVSAYASSELLKEQAAAIFRQNNDDTNDIEMPTFNRSL